MLVTMNPGGIRPPLFQRQWLGDELGRLADRGRRRQAADAREALTLIGLRVEFACSDMKTADLDK